MKFILLFYCIFYSNIAHTQLENLSIGLAHDEEGISTYIVVKENGITIDTIYATGRYSDDCKELPYWFNTRYDVSIITGPLYKRYMLGDTPKWKNVWRSVKQRGLPKFRPLGFDMRPHVYERFELRGIEDVYHIIMDKDGNDVKEEKLDLDSCCMPLIYVEGEGHPNKTGFTPRVD